MSRATDVAFPAVIPDVLAPGAPMAAWPGQLRLAVERLPLAAYVYDDDDPDVIYDAPGDVYVYDAPFIGEGYADLLCDFTSAVIAHPPPDESFLFPASAATVTLADPTGQYATVDAAGRLVYWAPGRRMAIWWTDDTAQSWWLFHGRVGAWRQDADGSITITAYCGFDELATDQGFDWYTAAGVGSLSNRRAPEVCQRVMAAVDYRQKTVWTDYTAADFQAAPTPGGEIIHGSPLLPLDSPDESTIPLDVMRLATLTEMGALYCDVDDVIRFAWHDWREGRDDQTGTPPAFTDNVCEPDVLNVWDVTLTDDDDWVATEVAFTNQNGQTLRMATPATGGWYQGVRYVYTPPDRLLFPDQANPPAPNDPNFLIGQVMSYTLTTRADPRTAVEHCKLYVHDPRQDLWTFAIDRRRQDLLRFLSDRPAVDGTHRLDLAVCVVGMVHTITPDSWETDLYTTPAVT